MNHTLVREGCFFCGGRIGAGEAIIMAFVAFAVLLLMSGAFVAYYNRPLKTCWKEFHGVYDEENNERSTWFTRNGLPMETVDVVRAAQTPDIAV